MKSYKYATESVFLLGLTILAGNQADASFAPSGGEIAPAMAPPVVSTTAADLVMPPASPQVERSLTEAQPRFAVQPAVQSSDRVKGTTTRLGNDLSGSESEVSLSPNPPVLEEGVLLNAAFQHPVAEKKESFGKGNSQAIQEPPVADPELGVIRVRSTVEDPELGIIRTREQPPRALPTPAPPPVAFLTGRVSAVSSGNIFLSSDPRVGAVSDQIIRPGITLGLYPALGPQTTLVATADVNLQRYLNTPLANYDEVRFRLGIRQGLTPRSYAQFSASHQELFRSGFKDRFFSNNSAELLLSRRDPLTPDLALNTYYQIQMNFSAPQTFDRLVQLGGAYLSYQITPRLQAGLNYQISLADYTSFERFDTYQQLFGQLVYQISSDIRVNLFGGISFGRSSVPSVRFDDTVLGISVEGNWALF